jgi:hypothetical protein
MNFARWSLCELRGGGNHHYCRSSVICPSKTTIYEVVTTPVCVGMIPLHAVSVRGPKEAPVIHSRDRQRHTHHMWDMPSENEYIKNLKS